ncbi:MAG: NHLP bacteriocin export ABC transporter permease/ATPase subunit [Oscillospiraceae bacterium]|jgi:NHLM bacteriocin system ABC transporter ATP-binding protein|nr:NHLP bacteriocin export ABC transporter permease/ATPase subunit [Oscillospiraceae bacterium]
MGWVDEQIKSRIKTDEKNFENSMMDLSSVVLGKKAIAANLNNERQKTENAIGEILKYYKIEIKAIPEEVKSFDEQLDYVLRPTGIMRRNIRLEGKWWTNAAGPLLGHTEKGDTIALLPNGVSGYHFFDYATGKKIPLSSNTSKLLLADAVCFYKPFPLKKLTIKDLILFTISTLTKSDIVMIALSTIAVTFIGMLTPMITKLQYEQLAPSNNTKLILPVAFILMGSAISTQLIGITKNLIMKRVQIKMSIYVESATMSRVISLPASFFKAYSAGDLATRVSGMQQLCITLVDAFLSTGLSSVFSLAYVSQMISYGPAMVIPGVIIIVLQAAVMILGTFVGLKNARKSTNVNTHLSGLLFSLFSGIQKIKLAGGERRMFAQWANAYKETAMLQHNPPVITKVLPIFSTVVSSLSSLLFYYSGGASGVTPANFLAFLSAFSAVSGVISQLIGMSTQFTLIKPTLELVEPILKTEPEISKNKKIITNISGSIDVQHISFSYIKNGPKILNDISLKIRPGQYVAIVGTTGCGKSTLMRLLLGFEKPSLGSIYYDGVDMKKIDMRSLRQHIGVVMQNGKLFSGDIYSNIVISAPQLNLDEAWHAAELAGIKQDIEDMPMGMHTLISEGSGGISGGQRQRLMIARAIAPKPKILMLDEATSALDNITQKQVSNSLESLKSTRIVIAHRLSTIKHCDRIIMLDKGKIVEDGNYEELIKIKGKFAELVERQRVDSKKEDSALTAQPTATGTFPPEPKPPTGTTPTTGTIPPTKPNVPTETPPTEPEAP